MSSWGRKPSMIISYYYEISTPSVKNITSASSLRNAKISQDGDKISRIPHRRWRLDTAGSEDEAADGLRPNGFYIQS